MTAKTKRKRAPVTYYLQIKALGKLPRVDIDIGEFEALRRARKTLSNALSQEEAYDILVSNHLEFERELVCQAADDMMRSAHTYESLFAMKAVLARRMANLLTAGRLYADQAPRHYAECVNSKGAKAFVNELLSEQYDTHFEYRFMCAYRNHVQHFTATVDSLSVGGARDRESMHLSFVVEPYAEKKRLKLNKEFKKSILDEMEERVDLRRMARGYVSALSEVHHQLRKGAQTLVDTARQKVSNTMSLYAEELGQKPVGLHAIHEEEGVEIEAFPLLLDWDETRMWLVGRNQRLAGLAKRYVTSEIKVKTPHKH